MFNLAAIAEIKAKVAQAVEDEARAILAVAQERIPVAVGVAHDSGRVVSDGDTTWITFGKDDDGSGSHAPSNSYIEHLHEDLAVHHKTGEAKFLQSAADDATAGLAGRVAEKARV